MKHLKSYKLFESVEKLYHKIDSNQWNLYTSGDIEIGLPNDDPFYVENWEAITSKEFNQIEELLPEIKNAEWLEPFSLNNCRLDWNHQAWCITIIKLKDEWFYVVINDDYYRCDGVEGVTELIKDLDLVKLNRREWPKPKLESNLSYKEITREEYIQLTCSDGDVGDVVFEEYSTDTLQEVQDFLEDNFLSVLEDWGFEEAREEAMAMFDVLDNKDKVYYFYKSYRNKKVTLTLLANTSDLVNIKIKQDRDLMSELRPIFKRVESVYPESSIENNITIEPTRFEPFFRVVITIVTN